MKRASLASDHASPTHHCRGRDYLRECGLKVGQISALIGAPRTSVWRWLKIGHQHYCPPESQLRLLSYEISRLPLAMRGPSRRPWTAVSEE